MKNKGNNITPLPESIKKAIEDELGYCGRMIGFSKTYYRRAFPDNLIVFNANLIVDGKKVWYGDVDVSIDHDKLKAIALKIYRPVYLLTEMDGRFGDNEDNPKVEKYVYYTDGYEEKLGESYKPYYNIVDGKIFYIKENKNK
jgi:hypothetical protein